MNTVKPKNQKKMKKSLGLVTFKIKTLSQYFMVVVNWWKMSSLNKFSKTELFFVVFVFLKGEGDIVL